MGQITNQVDYRCDDDCVQSGCPGHIATLTFNSISNIYHFNNGKDIDIYLDKNQIEAFVKMLKMFSDTRADTFHF